MNCFKYYFDSDSINSTYTNLILFGLELFKDALIIKKIEELDEYLERYEAGLIDSNESAKFISPFIFQNLVDIIKICIFFENYMKAELLKKGYLLHIIDRTKISDLGKKQKTHPILFQELNENKKIIYNNEKKEVCHEALKVETIKFSTLLNNRKYLSEVSIPNEIVVFLKEINNDRNKLHLQNELELTLFS